VGADGEQAMQCWVGKDMVMQGRDKQNWILGAVNGSGEWGTLIKRTGMTQVV